MIDHQKKKKDKKLVRHSLEELGPMPGAAEEETMGKILFLYRKQERGHDHAESEFLWVML